MRRISALAALLILLAAGATMALPGSDSANTHAGGEGHGEGIDAVYSSDEPMGLLTITLKQRPTENVTITLISASDAQTVENMEGTKQLNVLVRPLLMETYTVMVSYVSTGEIIAQCDLPVIETVALTYSSEGGSGYMPPSQVAPGTTVTLAQCGFDAPEGKSFLYWTIDGTVYQPGSSIRVDKDLTARAVWSERVCVLSFDPNGGTGEMSPVNVQYGEKVTLPECGFTAPDGRSFNGWEIDGKKYDAGSQFTITGDCTAKAIWSSGMDMMLIIGAVAVILVVLIAVMLILKRNR